MDETGDTTDFTDEDFLPIAKPPMKEVKSNDHDDDEKPGPSGNSMTFNQPYLDLYGNALNKPDLE